MMDSMNLLQPLPRYMRVNRRRRNIGMAEQQLHRAQICPVVEQMRCKGMPQGVWR